LLATQLFSILWKIICLWLINAIFLCAAKMYILNDLNHGNMSSFILTVRIIDINITFQYFKCLINLLYCTVYALLYCTVYALLSSHNLDWSAFIAQFMHCFHCTIYALFSLHNLFALLSLHGLCSAFIAQFRLISLDCSVLIAILSLISLDCSAFIDQFRLLRFHWSV